MAYDLREEQRENWGSRTGFILAAVGSAVGLGNLWGFPYKVYSFGGGAFLIPYLIAMLLVGVPLLILEFSLGHMTQRAAPDAYRGINRRSEPVGWWGILLGFVIITYYPVILAWCNLYFVECVKGIVSGEPLPWAGQGVEGVTNAKGFFFGQFLSMWPDEAVEAGRVRPWSLGGVVTPIAISLAVTWVLMYLCIFRGVKLVGKVVLWTVPLPWIMLLILTLRGLTLEGASQGLNFYLTPHWEQLIEPETWRWAFGQMFFSMSLAFGVMVTYASFLHRKSDLNNNAAIIGLADIGTSFVAGIAVFATLGAMAFATQQAGRPVPVTEVVTGGPGLAFVAFPYALAQLPYAPWFGAVFFLALLTLGIDSAFSITESVLASLVDKTGWNRNATLIGMSLVGLGVGLVYCTRGGLHWLGAMDSFINDPGGGIILLGMLEFVVVGWGYRLRRLREHANERSDWALGAWWDGIVRYGAPVVLAALFAWSVLERTVTERLTSAGPGGQTVWNWPVVTGLLIALAAPVAAVLLSLIHSPGANVHAQLTDRPRMGRRGGLVALVLVAMALAAALVGAGLVRGQLVAGSAALAGSMDASASTAAELAAEPAFWVLLAGMALALVGTVMAAGVVHRGEARRLRPSGLARLAAGWGVMTFGGAGGVLLSLGVLLGRARQAALGQPAAQAAAPSNELSGAALLVLAGVVALLVVGLGWCLYRAVKAAGGPEAEQLPEDGETEAGS